MANQAIGKARLRTRDREFAGGLDHEIRGVLGERGWRFIPSPSRVEWSAPAIAAPRAERRGASMEAKAAVDGKTAAAIKPASRPRGGRLLAGQRRVAGMFDSQYRAPLAIAPERADPAGVAAPAFIPAHKGQCSPEICWEFKDHASLLTGWAMAQRLPGRLGSTLYQLAQKYAGFAMLHGKFYISWRFVEDVARVGRRTFNNYVSRLVRLGYLRVVERAVNQWGVTYYDFSHCCGVQQLPLGTYIAGGTLYAARMGMEPSARALSALVWEGEGCEDADLTPDADMEENPLGASREVYRQSEDAAVDAAGERGEDGAREDFAAARGDDVGKAENNGECKENGDELSMGDASISATQDPTAVADTGGGRGYELREARGDAAADKPHEGAGARGFEEDEIRERVYSGSDRETYLAAIRRLAEDSRRKLAEVQPIAAIKDPDETPEDICGWFGRALDRPDMGGKVESLFALLGKGDLTDNERRMVCEWEDEWRAGFDGKRAPDRFLIYALLEARKGRSFRGLFFSVLRRALATDVAVYEGESADALDSFTRDLRRRRGRDDAVRAFWNGIPAPEWGGGSW